MTPRLALLAILIVLGLLPVSRSSWAMPPQEEPPPIEDLTGDITRPDKRGHPKLASVLNQALSKYREEGAEAALSFARERGVRVEGERVQVVVEVQDSPAATMAAAEALGGAIETRYENLIQVRVPIPALESLAERDEVRLVREPLFPVLDVTSEGVNLTGAHRWHSGSIPGSPYSGTGVKVAVLDLGFVGYSGLLGSELPASVTTQSFCGTLDSGTVHGTAVAEIVYDMAPGASMYLVKFCTEVEFLNAVDWLRGQTVDIINMSAGILGANNYDGLGVIASKVNQAKSEGILWANSAGNYAQMHWEGLFTDLDADGWHNFAGGDEGNTFFANAGQLLQIVLTWNDPWQASCNDYDLYLARSTGGLVAWSVNFQTCSQNPREAIAVYAPSTDWYTIFIDRYSGNPVYFDLYTTFSGLQYTVAASSLVTPADAAGAMAVGAIHWSTGALEPYSSQGPTNDGRTKPEITGPAQVSTATYGTTGFPGTSASSPHVAGAAALVWQRTKALNPGWTKQQVRDYVQDYLQKYALETGAPEQDNLFGWGRLQLGFFSDVPLTAWYAPYVEALVKASPPITTGCQSYQPPPSTSRPRYCPEDPVTRAQMAAFIQRTWGLPLP